MNLAILSGRLTKDPEIRGGGVNNLAVARFTLAVNHIKDDKADFLPVVCFGKTAELVEKYVKKGQLIGIQGRIQVSSYEKEGKRMYSTDIVADRIEFLESTKSRDTDNDMQYPDLFSA